MAASTCTVRANAAVAAVVLLAVGCSTLPPPGSATAPPPQPPASASATPPAAGSASPTPTGTPTAASSGTPSAAPTQTATPDTQPTATASATTPATPAATASGSPAAGTLAEQPGVQAALDAISNATIPVPATIPFFGDGLGTLYLPHDGSPSPADAPQIDLTGTSAFGHELTAGQAIALSAHACGSRGEREGVSFFTSCNQGGPMPAGEYLVFVSTYAAGVPEPFPPAAQCVYSFQSDVDRDRDTGFQSPLEFNHLRGSDVYFETLFFHDPAGEFRHYILATDYSMPPRTDTGEVHGNLRTAGRAWNLTSDGYAGHVAFVPVDEWGDSFSAGGFCNLDRAATGPDSLAVDALGEPSDPSFPEVIELAVDIFFPPRS